MRFTKMQGLGNDYVYLNCLQHTLKTPSQAAVALSNRRTGVGSDGLICICPSQVADFRMDMYNADGSQAEMCGNGIRCVGKYVYDKGLTRKTTITVETLAGIRTLHLHTAQGEVDQVTVNMGEPILTPAQIPVLWEGDRMINAPLTVGEQEFRVTCVGMGNPHAVIFLPTLAGLDLETLGPQFEHHPRFPNRINTEFVEVLSDDHLSMRVWERGSGETFACGTGACAVLAAAVLNGLSHPKATVSLLGGDLQIQWDQSGQGLLMTGPAVTVFEGELTGSPDWLAL